MKRFMITVILFIFMFASVIDFVEAGQHRRQKDPFTELFQNFFGPLGDSGRRLSISFLGCQSFKDGHKICKFYDASSNVLCFVYNSPINFGTGSDIVVFTDRSYL